MSEHVPDENTGAESRANLRVILDTVLDAIVTIDERGTMLSANLATQRMFGYSLQELIGQNVSLLMPSPYHQEHDQYLRNYCQTGVAKIIGIGREVVALRKDGSTFPIDLAVSEVVAGEARLFTGVIRDMTERTRAAAMLVQSERLAAIGQMVTGLAHESRNALQRASASLDMLSLDLGDDPRHIELIQRTRTALVELQRLYQEVRAYATPINLSLNTCQLADVWRESWQDLVQSDDVRSISFREEGRDCDTTCTVDHYRIGQVFRNVLENAVAASPPDGVVSLRCRQIERQGQPALEVSISDEGQGLSPEQAARAFEPFYTTKQRGTGLGLAICQRIVEAHEGEIRIDSTAPRGASVHILLPRTCQHRSLAALGSTDARPSPAPADRMQQSATDR